MSISLSSLAVGFGAAFPDFSERNPSRIASSPGGILTIVVSLFYIGIMMTLLAVPSYRYTAYLTAGGEFPYNEREQWTDACNFLAIRQCGNKAVLIERLVQALQLCS